MSVDVEEIKAANPIEGVIGEDEGLEQKARRRYLRGVEHDSLVVDTHAQYYVWNSQGETGDVFTWLEKRRRMDFKAAVTFLCRRGGLPEPQWGEEGTARVASSTTMAALPTPPPPPPPPRARHTRRAPERHRGGSWRCTGLM